MRRLHMMSESRTAYAQFSQRTECGHELCRDAAPYGEDVLGNSRRPAARFSNRRGQPAPVYNPITNITISHDAPGDRAGSR